MYVLNFVNDIFPSYFFDAAQREKIEAREKFKKRSPKLWPRYLQPCYQLPAACPPPTDRLQATVSNDCNLDFFLLISSFSPILGLIGQTNYASANHFLDMLSQHRKQNGLPACSANLGVMGEYAGMSKAGNDKEGLLGLLESHGFPPMKREDVMAKLEAILIQQPTNRMAAAIDWVQFKKVYPHLANDTRFRRVIGAEGVSKGPKKDGQGLRAELDSLEAGQKAFHLQEALRKALAKILDAEPSKIDVSQSLDALGLDSLMLTQFRNAILRLLDINLPMIKLLKGPSIETLSSELLTTLQSGTGQGGDPGTAEIRSTVEDLEGVSVLNPWVIRGNCPKSTPIQLVCFHSMGAGASLFTKFLIEPPKGYEVFAIQTPGRENRAHEPVMKDMNELVKQIVQALIPALDRPFVIWGHSFGGVVAREVVRILANEKKMIPLHLLVTGTAAPHLMHHWQSRDIFLKVNNEDASMDFLLSQIRFVDDIELVKEILTLMKVDQPLLQSYRYLQEPPFSFPITAFAARQDDMVFKDEIEEWAKHTSGGFKLLEVDGDHWFLNRNRKLISETLEKIALHTQGRDLIDDRKKAA